jgi:GTPase SAR1 family protein
VSIDFIRKDFKHKQYMYSVQLWDTPGQEAFRNVTKLHLMDANVVVIVFDYSSQNVTEQ